MHAKQYSRQQEKRNRIGNRTLVIGMDIGSDFNAACFMDKGGNVLGRYPAIYNSRKGFDYFQTVVMKTSRKYKFDDILIGMEPTGHYWRKIAFFAKERGYEVRFVRTTAVKHRKGA
jgi:transposase